MRRRSARDVAGERANGDLGKPFAVPSALISRRVGLKASTLGGPSAARQDTAGTSWITLSSRSSSFAN
jgi:hypothetical protein